MGEHATCNSKWKFCKMFDKLLQTTTIKPNACEVRNKQKKISEQNLCGAQLTIVKMKSKQKICMRNSFAYFVAHTHIHKYTHLHICAKMWLCAYMRMWMVARARSLNVGQQARCCCAAPLRCCCNIQCGRVAQEINECQQLLTTIQKISKGNNFHRILTKYCSILLSYPHILPCMHLPKVGAANESGTK